MMIVLIRASGANTWKTSEVHFANQSYKRFEPTHGIVKNKSKLAIHGGTGLPCLSKLNEAG